MLFTRGNHQLGYGVITDPATGQEEVDSLTCGHGHCGGRIVWMKPFQSGAAMGAHCKSCDKFICLQCVGKSCTPLEKWIEQVERRSGMR